MSSDFRNLSAGLLISCCLAFPLAAQETEPIDFNRDIKPVLAGRCYQCHGPDELTREAGLRLDSFDGATEDLGGYAAIVPGNPDASVLWERITSDDPDLVMPPAGHGEPLTGAQRQAIRTWIADGAAYARHWSYVPPRQTPPPTFEDPAAAAWIRNPIDRFTLDAMRRRGLEPAPEADRLTLARRVALDLTGLPPTVEQADAFANDPRPDAYERMVDRLLASDAYAEHWAAMWLDLSRYADSAGYAEDRQRTIWAYRDYVIRSFQKNQPYDEFTIQQLAGDLLPNPSDEDLIATAFHRNTLTNSEGGTDDEEFRTAAVVDRTNTTMAVWMGVTMACAQCHTHKYDPITQQEYFQVYAIFNSTADNDRPDEQPLLELYSDQQRQRQTELTARQQQLQGELDALQNTADAQQAARLDEAQAAWEIQLRDKLSAPITGQRVRIRLPGQNRVLQLAEVQVWSGDTNLALAGAARQSSTYPGGPAQQANDGNTSGVFEEASVAHTQHETDPWWEVDLGQPQQIERIVVFNRTDANLFERLNGFEVQILGDDQSVLWQQAFPQATKEPQTVSVLGAPPAIAAAVKLAADQRSPEQQKQLREYFLQQYPPLQQLRQQLAEVEQQLASIKPETTVPILRELEQARQTRIQIRGSFNNLGDEVAPGVPQALGPTPGESINRLTLARWLVSPENPLTARVAVNRYWQRLFGVGLVRTSEDFGVQGDLPTHPQLLDYLALQLSEGGWDNRALLKQIVMSATYRQSSAVTEEKRQRDPENRWLARGPRFRVSAEVVRDQALQAAGLLSRKMFGPPVRPPAPELGLKAAFSGNLSWQVSTGEDRYRRALYTYWRRSSPYPSMETFDVSNREVCDLRRISTNTPLQALVTLNDEVFVEAAQMLAQRMLRDVGTEGDPRQIARRGFRHVLIRQPEEAELDELVRLFEEARTHFQQDPESARQLAQPPVQALPEDTDWVSLASWTTVANVLLNLDEVFLKP